jgi:hypothetical protein
MPQVPATKTSASQNEIISAIVAVWGEVFGGKPTLSQVAKTWAQIAIETGHGKYFLNNNIGNIDWTPGFTGDYYIGSDTVAVGNDPNNRKTYHPKRRAYRNLFDGGKDYLMLLKHRAPVLETLQKGSPREFSTALAKVHYYDPSVRDDYVDKNGKRQHGYNSLLADNYYSFVKDYRSGKVQTNPNQYTSFRTPAKQEDNGFLATLEKWIGNLFAAKTNNISKYGAKYPRNQFLISISSKDKLASIEFARILKLAAKEELDANITVFADDTNIEVECIIDANNGQEILNELCYALSDTFQYATKKIGGTKIHTLIIPNQSSKYQILSIRSEDVCYELFHNRFRKLNGSE